LKPVEIIVAHDLGLFAMMGLASESSPAKLVLALAVFALRSVFADIADAFALPSGNIWTLTRGSPVLVCQGDTVSAPSK